MSDSPGAPTGLSLQEFRARQVRDYVFPNCGLAVKLKRHISILDLAAEGIIPQTLIESFQKVRSASDEDKARVSMEKLPELVPALNAMTKATVVSPPVADEPDETHVGVNEIPFADRLALFHELNAGAEALANFRQQPNGGTDAGPDSASLSSTSQPDPGG